MDVRGANSLLIVHCGSPTPNLITGVATSLSISISHHWNIYTENTSLAQEPMTRKTVWQFFWKLNLEFSNGPEILLEQPDPWMCAQLTWWQVLKQSLHRYAQVYMIAKSKSNLHAHHQMAGCINGGMPTQ